MPKCFVMGNTHNNIALPSISIIIPIYKVEQYVASCINSVINQDYCGKIECIIVDDCGGDSSMAIVRETITNYSGDIVFTVLEHEHNAGLSAARNTGLRKASGDYVFFLDSDDDIPVDAISRLSAPLSEQPFDVVVGEYSFPGKRLDINAKIPCGIVLRRDDVLQSYVRGEWPMTACNKLYRTYFLRSNELSFREGIIHEDELWSFMVACLADSLIAVDAQTYSYNIREGSITTSNHLSKSVPSYNIILEEMYAFVRSKGLSRNKAAHDKIERFRINNFEPLIGDDNLARETYIWQRTSIRNIWCDAFIANGFDFRRQLRDLHLAFPPGLGYCIFMKAIRHFFAR